MAHIMIWIAFYCKKELREKLHWFYHFCFIWDSHDLSKHIIGFNATTSRVHKNYWILIKDKTLSNCAQFDVLILVLHCNIETL